MASVIVGVDNGISGGLCAISSCGQSVISYQPMPTISIGDKKEVCVKGVLQYLDSLGRDIVVCIEEPLRHAKSSQAMRSMSISFGKIDGACAALQYSLKRVQVKEWQDVMLGKRLAKGQTKVVALNKANAYWPDEQWLATKRSTTAHDGIVDSALIARYYSLHK